MSQRPVTNLRHIGLAAPNYDEAVTFYQEAWGLKRVDGDKDISFFAAEGSPEQYILRLRRSDEKRIDLIALKADSAAEVDKLASDLAADGVRFASEPGKLQTPGGGYGFRFFDPDGRTLEVSSDVEERPFHYIEERDPTPVRLAHLVFMSTDAEQALNFYQDKLGFKLSDTIVGGLGFMRCSTDHHGIAFGQSKANKLNHVAFELRGIDEQMRATGKLMDQKVPFQRIIVRNIFGDNVSSYFFDPNGNVSEFTAEVEQIPLENGRAPRVLTPENNGSQWSGAGRFTPREEVPESALLPEGGYWVAPPV